ncbi:MAG: polysaccharide deacetylase family protein [Planctomycetota bacterium]|nr:polysaccharide deacetylase family protein [Planctomycetota bacterium]
MTEEGPSWWQRILTKGETGLDSLGGRRKLPVDTPTVGLCFDYIRDLRFESAYHSDEGLRHIMTVLARHGLRATFNCAAKLCDLVADQIHMLVEGGHEVAAMGYEAEVIRDLDNDQLKGMLYKCREAFSKRRLQPIGFRTRRSECDPRLYRELSLHRFLYNSEHDHAKMPYVLLDGEPPLVRIPVCTSDRGYIRRHHKPNIVVSKHHRYLRKAIARSHFISISFEPWILAEERQRMSDFEEWLETAVRSGAKIGSLADALPARYRTAKPFGEDD